LRTVTMQQLRQLPKHAAAFLMMQLMAKRQLPMHQRQLKTKQLSNQAIANINARLNT
jgi:hypothetical protein